jgi:hypothetical protein
MTRSLKIARRAAIAYTVTFAAGSYLSIKRGYPARALGIDTGSDVRRGVLGGIHGAGLAAPWNLVVQMWVVLGLVTKTGATGRRARAWLAFLAAFFIAGHVGEPVSHQIVTRELPPADTAVAVASIAVPIALLVAALASLVESEGECS